jgi:hypothetical protein
MLRPEEQERLEMFGYSWGRDPKSSKCGCYRNNQWTDEQAAAFRKGYLQGREMDARLNNPR